MVLNAAIDQTRRGESTVAAESAVAETQDDRSSTGRTFFVTLRSDRVISDNVRAFAYLR